MRLPTLYLRVDGKTRQWSVWTEDNVVVSEYGMLGGKLQQQRVVAKAKNVGRANETTPMQQAELEAQAKWRAQIDREDYAENVEDAGRQTRPMLALDATKVGHRVNWNDAVAQPKLDGLRLIAGYRYPDNRADFEMLTRKGEVHNVAHLMQPAQLLLTVVNEKFAAKTHPNACIAIDGEVYYHGWPLSKISSRAKKYYPGETELLQYHVFDLVAPGFCFEERCEILKKSFGELQDADAKSNLVLVPTLSVGGMVDLKHLHGMFIEAGYEGGIIRHRLGVYKMGVGGSRSPDLFKYKEFEEEECLIVGIYEDNNGNAMWSVRRKPTLEFGAGVVVGVTPKRSHNERKQMLREPEKWIGQWATIRYQTVTPDGSLQFPTGRNLRECDDLGEPLR